LSFASSGNVVYSERSLGGQEDHWIVACFSDCRLDPWNVSFQPTIK